MTITIKRLKEIIEFAPDNTPVLIPGGDHSYKKISGICLTTALFDDDGKTITEDYGEELTPSVRYGLRTDVLVIH